jgi:hypothetical protein
MKPQEVILTIAADHESGKDIALITAADCAKIARAYANACLTEEMGLGDDRSQAAKDEISWDAKFTEWEK